MIKVLLKIILGLSLICDGNSQIVEESPCPQIFTYEATAETNKWFGNLKIKPEVTLYGYWIDIILDNPAESIGNWGDDVSTTDYKEFKVENKGRILNAYSTYNFRFFINYNPRRIVPKISIIRLNGQQICSLSSTSDQRISSNIGDMRSNGQSTSQIGAISLNRKDSFGSSAEQLDRQPSTNTYRNSNENDNVNLYENEPNTQNNNRYTPTLERNSSTRNTFGTEILRDEIPTRNSETQFTNSENPSNRDTYSINQQTNKRRPLQRDASTQIYETSTKIIYPSQNFQPNNNGRESSSNNQENNDNVRRNFRPLNQPVDSTTRKPPKTTTSNYNGYESKDYEYSGTDRQNNNRNRDDDKDYFEGDFRLSSSSKIKPTPLPRNRISNNNDDENKCGKVAAQPRPLIVGGSLANEGQWPWHAAVYQTQTVDNKYICGGSLLSTSHIVTAAHCVTHRSSSRKVNPQTLTVYLGKYNLRKSTDSVQIMLVRQIHVHPQYNASNYYADLSILLFTKPCDYTMYVRPVCLWRETETELSNIIDKEGTVVGWGFDEEGRVTEELTLVRMPVVKQSTCLWSFKEFYTHFTSEQSYCAGFENGTSVCNGDSGGGMVFSETDYQDNSATWRLRGLVSIGVAKQYEYKCDPYHYVVFTDLAQFLDWIKEKISDSAI